MVAALRNGGGKPISMNRGGAGEQLAIEPFDGRRLCFATERDGLRWQRVGAVRYEWNQRHMANRCLKTVPGWPRCLLIVLNDAWVRSYNEPALGLWRSGDGAIASLLVEAAGPAR